MKNEIGLSFEMQQVNSTIEHIRKVQELLNKCSSELSNRAIWHDATKFSIAEWPYFLTHTKTLAGIIYGSPEYKKSLKEIRPALENHYKRNRHHPEYHLAWINDMTLLDILEMLCDWLAATKRHKDGNIIQSIELNQKRFSYGNELKKILINTVHELERTE
jgi:hypothetical protein